MDNVYTVDFDIVIDDCKQLLTDPRVAENIRDEDTGLVVKFQPLLYPKVLAKVVNTFGGVTLVVYIKVIEIEEVRDVNRLD